MTHAVKITISENPNSQQRQPFADANQTDQNIMQQVQYLMQTATANTERLKDVERNMAQQDTAIQNLQATVSDYEDRINSLDDQLDDQQIEMDQLRTASDQQAEDIDSLNSSVTALKVTVAAVSTLAGGATGVGIGAKIVQAGLTATSLSAAEIIGGSVGATIGAVTGATGSIIF